LLLQFTNYQRLLGGFFYFRGYDKVELMRIIKDIRFWIVLLFIVRLYGITNPPLEVNMTWRQCDVLMIARNFYEGKTNILYPRVDVAGTLTGIVGSEFPVYNYSIYLLAKLFTWQHWYGRIINLLLTSIAIWFFFMIIKEYFDESSAFNASIILLCSQSFALFRTMIPDPFGLSFCLIGLFFGLKYLKDGNIFHLVLFLLLVAIGCLAKISASILITVMAIPLIHKSIPFNRKIRLSIVSILILIIVILWYFYWVPILNKQYLFGGHFFMGTEFLKGLSQLVEYWPKALKQFYDAPLKYVGFILFLGCIFLCIKNKLYKALMTFAIPFIAYLIIIIKTGEMFTVNYHYPLLFIPSMAFIIGVGLSKIKNTRVVYVILFIVALENIANQVHLFKIKNSFLPFTKLEEIVTKCGIKSDDLIAINGYHEHLSSPMYFAHRKGWNVPGDELTKTEKIEELTKLGCKYVIILKNELGYNLELPHTRIFDSPDFAIYKLSLIKLN
jgi:hypothetical protein